METKEITFETAQLRIQEILSLLDSGKITLSEIETLLDEAQSLIDFSLSRLQDAENQLQKWKESHE